MAFNGHMGGSLLASEGHDTLALLEHPNGQVLQVKRYVDADTYSLAVRAIIDGKTYWSDLVMHPNGHSCKELGLRILAVWDLSSQANVARVQAQWQYIKDCGGLARSSVALLHTLGLNDLRDAGFDAYVNPRLEGHDRERAREAFNAGWAARKLIDYKVALGIDPR